jgi:acyl-CoA reductase-like NAD-dependent aldehyde dehydrogenase
MVGVPNAESAAQRARWLAELADALDEARDLVRQLGIEEGRIDAIDVSARIEVVRNEVQTMRLMRSSGGGRDFNPEWTKNIPWRLSA